MHTPNPEIQMPQAGRRRGRYSEDFKRQVVGRCLEPGVSVFKASNASVLAHVDLCQKKVGDGQGTQNRSYRNDATGINFEEFIFSLERAVFGHQNYFVKGFWPYRSMEERCGAEGDQLPPDYGRGAAS